MVGELVLVTGPPAAGKTTLARPLAAARAPYRHPGHVDHQLAPELLARGAGPLRLGGPVLEVDTARPVDVARVAAWVRAHRAGAP